MHLSSAAALALQWPPPPLHLAHPIALRAQAAWALGACAFWRSSTEEDDLVEDDDDGLEDDLRRQVRWRQAVEHPYRQKKEPFRETRYGAENHGRYYDLGRERSMSPPPSERLEPRRSAS